MPRSAAVLTNPDADALAALLERLGGVPSERILCEPPPGTATEADVVRLADGAAKRLCELVDGTLVEKAMGAPESLIAARMIRMLDEFAERHDLGLVGGSDYLVRLFPEHVRVPDAVFTSWGRFPDGQAPALPVTPVVPDLTVEVLSRSNTPAEMERKRRDYFAAGVRLVWEIDPRTRTVAVFTSPETSLVLAGEASLDGGEVLPGFSLPLPRLFAVLDRRS